MAITKPAVITPFATSVEPGPTDLFNVPSYMATGFPAPAGVPVVPAMGFFNWLFNYATKGVRYLASRGVPEWNVSEADYTVGSVIRDITDGFVYGLVGTATTGVEPHSDLTNWFRVSNYPRAIIGQYATAVQKFMNARQQTGSFVDHLGFVSGKLLEWDENWLYNTSHSAPGTGTLGPWAYNIRNSGSVGAAGAASNLSVAPWGPLCQVGTGATFGATSVLEYPFALVQMAAAAVMFEYDFSINGSTAPDASSSFAIGLGDGSLAANTSDVAFNSGGGPTPVGVAIYSNGTTGAGWASYVKPPGGSVHGSSIGITMARDAPHRIRHEILGTSSSDDATARVLTYVDGALVDNQAFNMNGAFLYPFIRHICDAANTCVITVGRIRMIARLALGDVSI